MISMVEVHHVQKLGTTVLVYIHVAGSSHAITEGRKGLKAELDEVYRGRFAGKMLRVMVNIFLHDTQLIN